jgi:serine/threonine-protein kinase
VFKHIGRYTLVNRIGTGPHAEVYLAVGACLPGLGKHYAVKVIHRQVSAHEGFANALREEVRLALGFAHPNVVAVADVGFDNGHWFMATEAVLGRNLDAFARACRRRNQSPPLLAALYIAREVLLGLANCHLKTEKTPGLDRVHREINARNVLISFDGAVKLSDFGLAISKERRLRRQPADRRADVFCVGGLLYELITGVRFDPQTSTQDLVANLRKRSCPGQSPPLEGVESLFCKLLAPDSRQRFDSAQEAASAIRRVLAALDPWYDGWSIAKLMNELFAVSEEQASRAALATVAHGDPVAGRHFGPEDERALPPTVLDIASGAPGCATSGYALEPDGKLRRVRFADRWMRIAAEQHTTLTSARPSGHDPKPDGKLRRVRFAARGMRIDSM